MASGPIIGSQYCLPHPVDLAFTGKVAGVKHGDLSITDINGNLLFWLEVPLWENKKQLIDANSRQPLISMKVKILSLHNEWQVFRGDSTETKEKLLFTVRRSSFFQMNKEFEVFLAANYSKDLADFKIKGKYKKRSIMIYKGDTSTVLAQMSKEHKVEKVKVDKDAVGVRINPNTDLAFIVSLLIMMQVLSEHEHSMNYGETSRGMVDVVGELLKL